MRRCGGTTRSRAAASRNELVTLPCEHYNQPLYNYHLPDNINENHRPRCSKSWTNQEQANVEACMDKMGKSERPGSLLGLTF